MKPFRNKKFLIFLCVVILTLVSLPTWSKQDKAPRSPLSLTFGLYQTDKATVMYRKFLPVIEHLQDLMEKSTQRNVDIKLEIFRTYEEGINAITNNRVDFVRFGPASYVIAKQRDPQVRLLVMERKKGYKRFKGVIAVRQDSRFQRLSDIKNASFAFGNKFSTIGRYLAQYQLFQSGITGNSLKKYDYLGRHDKVFSAIEFGDYDAGSLKMSTFKRLNKEGKLRILHSFDNVTKPWLARSQIPNGVYKLIKNTLLSVDDPETLKALNISDFVKAKDKDYQTVRNAMDASKKFLF